MASEPPLLDLEELLTQAAAGHADAWARIVGHYTPRVFGLLLKQCRDRELAEEIAQATFVRLVTSIGKYREQGRFEPWLFRIAMNQLRDEMRRRKRQARPMDMTGSAVDGTSGGASAWGAAEQHAAMAKAAEHNPMEQASREEQVSLMRQAVLELNDADQEVLHLRHTAGLSFAEIAETLGEPLGTVLARGHRALKKLRRVLEESYGVTEG